MKRRRPSFGLTQDRPHRAVLYGRYSSSMQSDGWSLDAQLGDLRRYCQAHEWEIVAEFADEALSGKTDQRPEFQKALDTIRTGRATIMVVHKLDRFSRSMDDTFRLVNEFEQCGAGLVCTQQGIDTTNPISGKIVLAVLAALAEAYLDNLSEETAKGKRARVEAGLYNGDLSYGYVNPDAGTDASGAGINNATTPIVVPERAVLVRQAYEWYATGQYSDQRVAQALNDAGCLMVSKHQPQGGPFKKDTITALLQNRFYIGDVRQPDGSYKPGRHEPVIDADLFARAQAARRAKHHRGHASSPMRHAHTYVAAGIIYCASCGQPMRAQGAANRKPGYSDPSKARGIRCATRHKSIPEPDVEQALHAAVSGLRLPDDWRTVAIANLNATDDDEAARIHARRAALEGKLDRLKGLVKEGIIEPNEYRADKAAIDAELGALPTPQRADIDLDRAAALIDDMQSLWSAASREERREIAHALFEGVWVNLDTRRDFQVQLKNTLACLESVLPNRTECTSGGTDEIRTRDLLRDRQACWATTPRLQGHVSPDTSKG